MADILQSGQLTHTDWLNKLMGDRKLCIICLIDGSEIQIFHIESYIELIISQSCSKIWKSYCIENQCLTIHSIDGSNSVINAILVFIISLKLIKNPITHLVFVRQYQLQLSYFDDFQQGNWTYNSIFNEQFTIILQHSFHTII